MLGNKAIKAALMVTLVTLSGLLPLQASAECKFVSTKDGSPLVIKAVDSIHQKLNNL
jgi:hypothetical protein